MPILIEIKLPPEQAADSAAIQLAAAEASGLNAKQISHIKMVRKSLDARKKEIVYVLRLEVYQAGELPLEKSALSFNKVSDKRTCHIIGFGPAGIFAALQCLERGIKPIVLERGKPVNERIADISAIHKKLYINPDSNYCFGEGGAGTYSDGKLYTRSTKRGDIHKVLRIFIEHGADERIGYEAHPHIGTNKLPRIIENIRNTIIAQGGEVHFHKNVTDFTIESDTITEIHCADGSTYPCQQLILATGHSARNIFELLHHKNIAIDAKPFALGVRIEHRQEIIDRIQYKRPERGVYLPPATYSLVTQACGRGVFSFCMCPGGVIAPAATDANETVVNGWSSSARNGPFSNSGIVVEVKPENWQAFHQAGPLAALAFQKHVEQITFEATGSIQAPAQRMEDFIQKKTSATLPRTSYQPGIISYDLSEVLPDFINTSLRQGLIDFGKKMYGYRTNEAIMVGVESRTSSPVRIPRSKETMRHPHISNLLPCGEGAGYAGGIVSAAMDGMACAMQLSC